MPRRHRPSPLLAFALLAAGCGPEVAVSTPSPNCPIPTLAMEITVPVTPGSTFAGQCLTTPLPLDAAGVPTCAVFELDRERRDWAKRARRRRGG